MKANKGLEVVGGQDGLETQAFEVDSGPAIETFRSSIYTRRDTFCQELMANGRDGIRERRQKEPGHKGRIVVRFAGNQVSFQDDGCGMSRSLLRSIYSTLGKSTRRDSDEFSGHWGYGSKSPLKVADSFTVVTRSMADRKQYTLVIGKFMVDGAARWAYKVTHECDADGDWGTTVTVPVPSDIIEDCRLRVRETARHWQEEVVLEHGGDAYVISGQEVRPAGTLVEAHTDSFHVYAQDSSQYGNNSCVILVDGIRYEYHHKDAPHGIQFKIDLTAPSLIDLTAGREFLDASPRTHQLYRDAVQAIKSQVESRLREALDQLDSFLEYDSELHGRIIGLNRLAKAFRMEMTSEVHPLLQAVMPVVLDGSGKKSQAHDFIHNRRDTFSRRTERQSVFLHELFRGSPVYFGKKLHTTAAVDALQEEDMPMYGRHCFFFVAPDPELQQLLRRHGARELGFKRSRASQIGLRVEGQEVVVEDLNDKQRKLPIVLVDAVAHTKIPVDFDCLFGVRLPQRAVAQLREEGFRLLSLAEVQDKALAKLPEDILLSSKGQVGLRDVARSKWTLVRNLPAWALAYLAEGQDVVRVTDQQLDLLRDYRALHPEDPLPNQASAESLLLRGGRRLGKALLDASPFMEHVVVHARDADMTTELHAFLDAHPVDLKPHMALFPGGHDDILDGVVQTNRGAMSVRALKGHEQVLAHPLPSWLLEGSTCFDEENSLLLIGANDEQRTALQAALLGSTRVEYVSLYRIQRGKQTLQEHLAGLHPLARILVQDELPGGLARLEAFTVDASGRRAPPADLNP